MSSNEMLCDAWDVADLSWLCGQSHWGVLLCHCGGGRSKLVSRAINLLPIVFVTKMLVVITWGTVVTLGHPNTPSASPHLPHLPLLQPDCHIHPNMTSILSTDYSAVPAGKIKLAKWRRLSRRRCRECGCQSIKAQLVTFRLCSD